MHVCIDVNQFNRQFFAFKLLQYLWQMLTMLEELFWFWFVDVMIFLHSEYYKKEIQSVKNIGGDVTEATNSLANVYEKMGQADEAARLRQQVKK